MKKTLFTLLLCLVAGFLFSQDKGKTFRLKYLLGAPEARGIKNELIKKVKEKHPSRQSYSFKPARAFTRIRPKIKL